MNIKTLILGISAASIMCAQQAAASTMPLNPKVDSFVRNQFKSTSKAANSVFVILQDQADLSGADAMTSREQKARYVYDTLRHKSIETQGPLVELLKARKVKFRQYYIENMIAVENPSPELVNELAARHDVSRIMGNPLVRLKLPKQVKVSKSLHKAEGPEQSLVRIGATNVWKNYNVRGEGIVIAGQDTGVQWDHPAIKNQYRGFNNGNTDHNYNWHDAIHSQLDKSMPKSACGYDSKTPCDDHGHGTHTIGTIVGDDGNGNQIGVAPKAQWMACKNMDNGLGSTASYIECFEFFLAPYPVNGNALTDGEPAKAPHVINNSWSCTAEEGCTGDEILPTLQAMKKAGIFVIASAGNDGPGCSSIDAPPAWHTGLTMAIGAFDHRNDQIAMFSSRGPSQFDGGVGPNISAPGVQIRSAFPGNSYTTMSGTSMAGPHAVGVAALLWSYNKNLIGQIDKTISILENSAEPKAAIDSCGGVPGSHIPNNTYGAGLINVEKAVCSQSDHCAA